jgi:hypothetical protein
MNLTKNKVLMASIGVVYLWFGALKFIPNLSPAEHLAQDTIHELTFGLLDARISILLLAILETGIGLFLLLNRFRKIILPLAIGHIVLTFTPLFLFPELVFGDVPFSLTILGQYIAKNIIILSVLVFEYVEFRQVVKAPSFRKMAVGDAVEDTFDERKLERQLN